LKKTSSLAGVSTAEYVANEEAMCNKGEEDEKDDWRADEWKDQCKGGDEDNGKNTGRKCISRVVCLGVHHWEFASVAVVVSDRNSTDL
jgi:hypothetical protein